MRIEGWKLSPDATVQNLGGIEGGTWKASRYKLHHPYAYTGKESIDAHLSTFEVAVAPPPGRDPATAPVAFVLEAISTPYRRAQYFIPMLHELGIACVLFETPLSGSRSLVGDSSRNPARELAPLANSGVDLSAAFMRRLMEGVAGDFEAVCRLAAERHGLAEARPDGRLALVGISFGCLLSSFAFLHSGVGARLLGIIGHADLVSFAGGLSREIRRHFKGLPLDQLASGPGWALLRPVVQRHFGEDGVGALHFLRLLFELTRGGEEAQRANPLSYGDRARPGRRVRFLVGTRDEVARAGDAEACVHRLPDARCHVEDCLAHGYVVCGPGYQTLVRRFLAHELADWHAENGAA